MRAKIVYHQICSEDEEGFIPKNGSCIVSIDTVPGDGDEVTFPVFNPDGYTKHVGIAVGVEYDYTPDADQQVIISVEEDVCRED